MVNYVNRGDYKVFMQRMSVVIWNLHCLQLNRLLLRREVIKCGTKCVQWKRMGRGKRHPLKFTWKYDSEESEL